MLACESPNPIFYLLCGLLALNPTLLRSIKTAVNPQKQTHFRQISLSDFRFASLLAETSLRQFTPMGSILIFRSQSYFINCKNTSSPFKEPTTHSLAWVSLAVGVAGVNNRVRYLFWQFCLDYLFGIGAPICSWCHHSNEKQNDEDEKQKAKKKTTKMTMTKAEPKEDDDNDKGGARRRRKRIRLVSRFFFSVIWPLSIHEERERTPQSSANWLATCFTSTNDSRWAFHTMNEPTSFAVDSQCFKGNNPGSATYIRQLGTLQTNR